MTRKKKLEMEPQLNPISLCNVLNWYKVPLSHKVVCSAWKKNQVKKTTELLLRHVKEMSVGAEMA